MGVEAKLWNE